MIYLEWLFSLAIKIPRESSFTGKIPERKKIWHFQSLEPKKMDFFRTTIFIRARNSHVKVHSVRKCLTDKDSSIPQPKQQNDLSRTTPFAHNQTPPRESSFGGKNSRKRNLETYVPQTETRTLRVLLVRGESASEKVRHVGAGSEKISALASRCAARITKIFSHSAPQIGPRSC
jgi:hypothetical protein